MWGLHLLSPREALEALLAAVRARRRLIVALGVVAFVGTLALNAAAPYTARMVIAFTPLNESRTLSDVGVPAPPAPTAGALTSTSILQRMIDEQLAARPETVGTLQHKLTLERYTGGEATLLATGDTEQDAVNLVSGWNAALQRSRADALDAQFANAESALRDQLAQARRRRGQAGPLDERDLARQVSRLLEARRAVPQEVSVIEGANAVGGGGIRNEIAVLLLALAVGTLLALALDLREGRLRTPAAAAAGFRVPVLGRLSPDASAGDLAARLDATAGATNGAGSAGTVLLTPSEAVERPHEAALLLARAFAGDGRSTTLLVWRDETSATALGLTRDTELEDERLRVVLEERPARDLAARLAELRLRADRIVILAPALAREPSGLLVAKAADLWLVLAVLGQTREAEARALVEGLKGFDRPPDGLLVADDPAAVAVPA